MGRTALIVQARLGSSRLPGKMLMELAGQTVLAHVLTRCRAVQGVDVVCCATSTNPEDEDIAAEAVRCAVEVFRGSEDDVLDRYHEAAKQLKADIILRVTGDCPMIDPEVCAQVLRLRARSSADYAANNLPPSFPHGLDCEAFTFAWLEKSAREASLAPHREHVTPYIRLYDLAKKVNLYASGDDCSQHRWVLDIEADLDFLQEFMSKLPESPAGWNYRMALSILDDAPYLLERSIAEDRRAGPEDTRFIGLQGARTTQ